MRNTTFLLLLLATAKFDTLAAAAGQFEEAEEDQATIVSDFRQVSYEELLPGLEQFFDGTTPHFSELLFDFPRYQLIVGARDALYRLSLEGLTNLEKADWPATDVTVGLCTAKGQSESACHNYIKVLVAQNDRIFACGTHAFSPKCSWREIEAVNRVTKWVDGRGKCPYSPEANSSALMTQSGDYYIASSTDFSSNDHAIYRMSGKSFDDLVRTVQYNSLWLAQPDFVATFETDTYVYFLFRENAIEYMNCGKAVYSRIARVCKNDKGGQLVLKDNWTTFIKARLNCSVAGDFPFYYDEIQSAQYVAQEGGIVYATFSTPENSIAGSAICSFNLTAIEETFEGPFKKQSRPDSTWEPQNGDHSHFQCQPSSSNKEQFKANSREYQLINKAVPSTKQAPLYQEHLGRFTHIVVDSVLTKHQDNHPVHVIFVATRSGVVKKLSFNTRTQQTCVVEILHPFATGRDVPVHNLKLLTDTSSIYLATEENVIRLPVQRCHRFRTKRACLNAMDPYCGWNKQKSECTATPNKNPRAAYWQQNLLSCPILSDPIDGQWGDWSSWFQCDYNNPDERIDSHGDYCQCRKRKCDNPAPANDGAECDGGRALEVTNCTRHGGWTDWSDWSACSQSCDVGMRQRRRSCGNPSPAFGGRVCVGRDIDSQYCTDLPPCISSSIVSNSAALVRKQDKGGLWAQWTDWSDCSAECGRGFRTRTRRCYSSSGLCEGGCAKEFEECENKQCSDLMEVTDWTPWVKTNLSKVGGSWYESRYRFTYRAPVAINQVGQVNSEERFCRGVNSCTVTSVKSSDSSSSAIDNWSDWTKCTRECGGGYQLRLRSCPFGSSHCVGGSVTQRACNTQPCPGQWGCWSDWSGCDRHGLKKHRSRNCQTINGVVSGDRSAPMCSTGSSYEEMTCDGWGLWSDWSACDLATDTRTRMRSCVADQCNGSDMESQPCTNGLPRTTTSTSSNLVAVACICCFVIGAGLGAGLVFYLLRFRRPGGNNGSPHYVSAKSQNLYVSLPMLDLKHKHLSSNQSDCGTMRSTSTLRSKAGSSIYNGHTNGRVSEYETATIKRSHSQRNSSLIGGGTGPNSSNHVMRADLDSDQLFN